jgi:hypothetical protein
MENDINTNDKDQNPEEDLLAYTQSVRKEAIELHFKKDGHVNIKDNDDVHALATLLRDMDTQEINKAKLKVDKEANTNKEATLQLVNAMINSISFDTFKTNNPINRTDISLPDDIGDREYVEGEMSVGVSTLDADAFFQKNVQKDN